jgi:hypothetical protein
MESVAAHLRDHAFTVHDGREKDLFGRSAFNRYYYSAFLVVKSGLSSDFPSLPSAHKAIPQYLRATVADEMKKSARRATKISDSEGLHLFETAKSAAFDLASLLEAGYSTRVVADYHPESAVAFAGSRSFALNEVSVEVAQSWPSRARAFVSKIVEAKRSL